MKNNRGSAVIEMCFVAPVLIGVAFVAVNIFGLLIKTGGATEEAYTAAYDMGSESTYSAYDDSGEYTVEADYTMTVLGALQFTELGGADGSVTACRKIRDVGDELRRWQIYGGLLSD